MPECDDCGHEYGPDVPRSGSRIHDGLCILCGNQRLMTK